MLFGINIDGEDTNSWYLEPSVGYSLDQLSLSLAVGIAKKGGFYPGTEEGTAIISILPAASYAIPLGEGAEASVSVGVGFNPKTKFKMPFFTIGTGFSL